MKVAIVANGLCSGGAERVASMVANHYESIGHNVLYIAIYSDKKEYYLNENINYYYTNTNHKSGIKGLLERTKLIKKAILNFNADIILSFVEHEIFSLFIRKIPIIQSLRNDPKSTECGFFRKNIRNINYKIAKKVIFQTDGARQYFSKDIRKKGIIIRNPLTENLPYWHEENHNKVFMTACRLNYQKNLPMMIKAFAEFVKTHPNYKLEIYGEGSGDYLQQMQDIVNGLGCNNSILFKGRSLEVHKIMSESEAFILTSDFEGLSNSMLEAIAIGVPSICTDCPPGGAREIMLEKNAGILVPVGDVKALTNAMCKIADSRDLRLTLSKNEIYLREELDSKKILSMWAEVLF